MNEHLLKIEDCLSRAQAIGHLLACRDGNDNIRRSGLMIECEMSDAQDALDAHMSASRAEKGSADEAPNNGGPKPERSELHLDERRFCRAMSLLTVLLEKTEWSASTASEADTLEIAIAELNAAGGLEQ